ncbi:hypothetical protein [Rhodoferax sp.]|uniref:hypothetical protein n=1 Tax=Rhodoferax sp. TaxID=50421 RepID=UPI00261F08F3|nr:hypothetical protein [Rhodoferax sp.]MDD2924475.1 hypothetical protein [Rhodoferax sp.]
MSCKHQTNAIAHLANSASVATASACTGPRVGGGVVEFYPRCKSLALLDSSTKVGVTPPHRYSWSKTPSG